MRLTHRTPDRLGGDRQGDIAHAEMPQRVDHGVADRSGRADRPAFTAALDAERIARRGRLNESGVERWHIVSARHAVVHEARGQELTGIRLIDDMLAERLSDALGETAMDLALNDHRIDYDAAIVSRVHV